MSLTVYIVGLTKARIGFVENSSSQQTETTVSNKNECITAKRNQHDNSTQSTQIIYLCRTQLPAIGTK